MRLRVVCGLTHSVACRRHGARRLQVRWAPATVMKVARSIGGLYK